MNERETRQFLRKAIKAHVEPEHKVWAGMNFVQCSCGKHAHIQGNNKLLVHNSDYTFTEMIDPEQF